ncbi:MAG: DUF885 domain-containing protein [Bacteroidota bacterium]
MNHQFEHIAEEFLRGWLRAHPSTASWLGFHEHDGWVEDLRPEAVEAEVERLKRTLGALEGLEPDRLAPENYSDYQIILHQIWSELLEYEEIQSWKRNPMQYAQLFDVSGYIKRNYAPLEKRLRAVIAKEKKFAQVVETAKKNLLKQTARTFITTAIEIVEGQLVFLESGLPQEFAEVLDKELMQQFKSANAEAVDSIGDYLDYLKNELLPNANEEFALGPERFEKLLRYGEMVDKSLEELLELGLTELKRVQEAYRATATEIDANKSPLEVFRSMADDHPTAESLIADGASALVDLRQFLVDREIVPVPDGANLQVKESLPFDRWAFASLDPPGLFEARAAEAYYYITPVEPDWSARQREEWLRAFSYPILKIISIHEAYPGHFLHFLHYRNVPSKVARMFGSYSAIEGWAHYAEQMMVDEGYGSDDLRIRLAQLHEALIRLCRYVVAIRLHTQGMTVDDAARFFMENASMEEHPARKEAERGTFDPGYINYALGKLQILELREEMKSRLGDRFVLRDFHDIFLRHGALPIKLLREMVLD